MHAGLRRSPPVSEQSSSTEGPIPMTPDGVEDCCIRHI